MKIWIYRLRSSSSKEGRRFLWNEESVIRSRRKPCQAEPPLLLPRMRFRVNFIGEAAMKDGWIWNARGCRYALERGEYSFRGKLSCVTSLVTVQFTFLPRSTRREFYFPDRYLSSNAFRSFAPWSDLSRWNIFWEGGLELLVKIFIDSCDEEFYSLLLNFVCSFFFCSLYNSYFLVTRNYYRFESDDSA